MFGYMNYPGMMDPLRYMEMQAQYLRLLAQFLSDPEASDPPSSRPVPKPALVSASVQVEMPSEAPISVPEEVVFPTKPTLEKPKSSPKPATEVDEVTFSPPLCAPEETGLQARKRAKNFDDIPISTANKGFQQLLEAELEKEERPAVVLEGRTHAFLRKGSKTALTVKAAQQKSEEAESENRQKATRRDFLKRRSGKLCVKKGQLSPPQQRNAQKSTESVQFPPEKRGNIGPDQVLGPAGADVIEKLKREVVNLQSEVRKLRSGLSEDVEEALNTAIELAKNERETMKEEFAASKRQEMANVGRGKGQSRDFVDAETLKARIRQLQEEAKVQEDAHRTACDSIRQQLESMRKKPSVPKGKPSPFKGPPGPDTRPMPRAESAKPEVSKATNPSARDELAVWRPATASAEEVKIAKTGKSPQIHQSAKSDFSRFSPKSTEIGPEEAKVQSQTAAPDGKIQRIYTDGRKEVIFPNGVRKEVLPDGSTSVFFTNKDVKQTFADGKVVYHFSEAQTTQTTFPDKLQIFHFSNGQTEKHFPDGKKEIQFTDGTVKTILPDGQEESVFPDGTMQRVDAQGVKFIESVSGQRDTLYPDGTKVREYPDGTVKKYRADGRLIDS